MVNSDYICDMKKKASKTKKRLGCAAAILLSLVAAAAVIGYLFITKKYSGEDKWIFVPRSATNETVRDSLVAHLGESGERVYMMWDAVDGKLSVAHGAYLIKSGEKESGIARRLKNGQQTPVKLTINNVRTMEQLAERIAARFEWSGEEFLATCDSVLPAAGFKKEGYPAAFFPDTYEFYWTNEPKRVVERLLDYRNKFWNDDRRAKAKALNLTPIGAATVASIVEEETVRSDERPIVARLYLNRLHKGMLLQADPTVKYAVGDFSLRRITHRHLEIESPYNTYKHAGLPPGPIRVVDKSTVDAVLNAPKHNYLYMCAKEDFSGRHNFAVDLATHQRNAARYQAELNRRKIYK